MRLLGSSLVDVLPGAVVRAFEPGDLAELVVLQRACWVQEAILNETLGIPALHEGADEVLAWATSWTTLVVRLDGRLVAAVRGHAEAATWEIGRLMAAPDLQGRGIGAVLLAQIESLAPAGTQQFELFTGAKSERNIRMYERAGYTLTQGRQPPGHITGAVWLTKPHHAAAETVGGES